MNIIHLGLSKITSLISQKKNKKKNLKFKPKQCFQFPTFFFNSHDDVPKEAAWNQPISCISLALGCGGVCIWGGDGGGGGVEGLGGGGGRGFGGGGWGVGVE